MSRSPDSITYMILKTLEAHQNGFCDLQTCKDILNNLLRMWTDKSLKGPNNGKRFYGHSSSEAAMSPENNSKIIYDHAVPIDVIVKLLIKKHPPLSEQINSLRLEIQELLRVVAITKDEDELLTRQNLKSAMPKNWLPEGDKYARYSEVGIVIAPSSTTTEAQVALKRHFEKR